MTRQPNTATEQPSVALPNLQFAQVHKVGSSRMTFVFGHDQFVAAWVQQRLAGIENGFGQYSAIGIENCGELIAGVVYHDYRRFSIQISMAAETPKWCSRRTLNILLGYPFNQCGVERITACTAKNNKRLRSMVERLGFKLEGTIRRGFDGKHDLLVYGLLKEDAAKWINRANQQAERIAA